MNQLKTKNSNPCPLLCKSLQLESIVISRWHSQNYKLRLMMASLGGRFIYDSAKHQHIQAEQLCFFNLYLLPTFLGSGTELNKYWHAMRNGIQFKWNWGASVGWRLKISRSWFYCRNLWDRRHESLLWLGFWIMISFLHLMIVNIKWDKVVCKAQMTIVHF